MEQPPTEPLTDDDGGDGDGDGDDDGAAAAAADDDDDDGCNGCCPLYVGSVGGPRVVVST